MIAKFIERFDAKRDTLLAGFKAAHPKDYMTVVRAVIEAVTDDKNDDYDPDPERIHEIDDGNYQGTLLYVIAAKGYQPCTYWAVPVSYGSCSGCDTLQSIGLYTSDPPTDEQANEYLTLALHVVQELRMIAGYNYAG